MIRGLSRRRFLRGVGGVVVGLPFLEALRSPAHAATSPKRFIAVFTPGGTVLPNWTPQGTGEGFLLGPILEPLEPHSGDITIVSGMQLSTALNQGGNPHTKGLAHGLTAVEWILDPLLTADNGEHGWGGGISLDREIAKHVGADTKLASIELGVQTSKFSPGNGTHPANRISYTGPTMPVSPEHDPAKAFDRLFSDFLVDDATLARERAQRRSVLDLVAEDFQMVNAQLGKSDQEKLEAHLEAIREIEKRLEAGGACTPPLLGDPIPDYETNVNFPSVGELHTDVMVAGLACDLTRVATLQWSSGYGSDAPVWVDLDAGHHTYQHAGVAGYEEALTTLYRWYAEQMAYLITKLKSVPEGDGTLLDNTVVLWFTEISDGPSHSQTDMPYVLAGKCGGALRTGQHVSLPGRAHGDLLVTLLNAMGVGAATFGDPAYCTGPIAQLLA